MNPSDNPDAIEGGTRADHAGKRLVTRWLCRGLAVLAVSGIWVVLFSCATGPAGTHSSPTTADSSAAPINGSDAPNAESGGDSGEPVARPGARVWGRVRFVHPSLRYAVMDFSLWQVPAFEQRLVVYRDGQAVGRIRITGPVVESTVAGDILSGDPRVGDEVRGE